MLRQLFVEGQNYASSDKWLHSKLFAQKSDGLMGVYEYDVLAISEDTSHRYQRELAKIVELNGFYDKCNTLLIS